MVAIDFSNHLVLFFPSRASISKLSCCCAFVGRLEVHHSAFVIALTIVFGSVGRLGGTSSLLAMKRSTKKKEISFFINNNKK